jgi:hypothetical protein
MPRGGRRTHAGRRPKPTDLKVVQGAFRTDRHGDEAQPAVHGWPDPPKHLTAREKALWQELQAHCEPWSAKSDWLAFNGVVSLMDRLLRVQEAQQATESAGNPISFKFTPSRDGEPNMEPKENPLYGLEMKLWRELRAFIALTGLSPADRARMRVDKPETPANPLERFLKKSK